MIKNSSAFCFQRLLIALAVISLSLSSSALAADTTGSEAASPAATSASETIPAASGESEAKAEKKTGSKKEKKSRDKKKKNTSEASTGASGAAAATGATAAGEEKESKEELKIDHTMIDPAEPSIPETDTKKSGDASSKKADEKAKVDEKGKKEEAKQALDPSRPYNPDAVKDYNQGVELQQQGFLNQAIQKYRNAIELDDRIEQAFCNLGLIYIAQRNFAKASDAFKKAIVLNRGKTFPFRGMGSEHEP